MVGKKCNFMIMLIWFNILIGSNNMFSMMPSAKSIFGDDKVVKLIDYIQHGKYKEANELIKNGLDIDFKSKEGITPLYYFFIKKDYNSFKKILELGANPNVYPNEVGIFSLINATMDIKDDRYFRELLLYKVDLDYEPKDGRYHVLEFSLSGTVDIKYLKMLLEHGIKLKYSEYLTDNPLLSALTNREYKKVILLLEYGADLNDTDPIKVYKREVTLRELFIERLEKYVQSPCSQLLKDQLELAKYLKDKFGIEVKLKYPNGR